MINFTLKDVTSVWKLKDKIAKVHEYLFYEANLESQIRKYKDECAEYCNADEKGKLEELADMYICACGIERFDYIIGTQLQKYVLKLQSSVYSEDQILEKVVEKMNILQQRTWKLDDKGYYQHEICTNGNEDYKKDTSSSKHNKK